MATEKKSNDIVKLELTRFLEAKGCRKTPERYAILNKMYSIHGHFDADALFAMMAQTEYRVSKATVYNTIELFVEAGLVHRHQFAGQSAQYECAYNIANHHHLICIECGSVQEMQGGELQELLQGKKISKFTPQTYALYLYGRCNKCLQAERRRKKAEERKTKTKTESTETRRK